MIPKIPRMNPLNDRDLAVYMQTHNIPGEIVRLEMPTPTVETAALAVDAHPGQIVKTVLFLIQGEPMLGLAAGLGRLDWRKIAAHFGVSRKKVRLADAAAVLEITGYPVGGVPPFGHRQPLPALLDPSIKAFGTVYAGGGTDHDLLQLTVETLVQFVQGEWVALKEDTKK